MAQILTNPASTENQKEQVIGIIPDVYRGKLFGGKEQYNLIITDKRITFALITPGITGPSSKIYSGKSSAQILSGNKKNFAVDRQSMKSFNFKAGHSYTDCCRKLQEIEGEISIVTPKNKYSFYVPFRRNDIAKDVLERAGLYKPEVNKTDSPSGETAGGSCCGH